ncbi:hypothetical protein PITC_059540 [Penicillium italicum]|uniref:Uncharacterized protein n=1 Tax=Penicillium italicum TaxID=40296 RepID=A0A0A2LGK5_PENIT|nr:hypothetical protein PITC_059540 [Penicillium italicum]
MGPTESEDCSLNLAQAIHHAQTMCCICRGRTSTLLYIF